MAAYTDYQIRNAYVPFIETFQNQGIAVNGRNLGVKVFDIIDLYVKEIGVAPYKELAIKIGNNEDVYVVNNTIGEFTVSKLSDIPANNITLQFTFPFSITAANFSIIGENFVIDEISGDIVSHVNSVVDNAGFSITTFGKNGNLATFSQGGNSFSEYLIRYYDNAPTIITPTII